MAWSKYAILVLCTVVILTTGFVGGKVGYTVNGVPHGGTDYVEAQTDNPWIPNFIEGIIDALGDAFGFLWDMLLFNIDDVPYFINMIFVVMSLVVLFIIVSLVRGTN